MRAMTSKRATGEGIPLRWLFAVDCRSDEAGGVVGGAFYPERRYAGDFAGGMRASGSQK